MASEQTEAVVLGDEFLADEILARLPACCAVRCTMLSKRFRQLLASPHFWLRHRRLGPPPELPHVARLYRHNFGMAFEFHVVGPTFAMKHTVDVDRCSYAGTCNGLVLVSRDDGSYGVQGQSSVEGVVFNPATKEEAHISLRLPHPQNNNVERCIFGFGYGSSKKVYKALIREVYKGCTRLIVVSLDNSNGQEPRTVFSCDDEMLCRHNLHTGDGKVYFLIYTMYLIGTDAYMEEDWVVTGVLAFDADAEVATNIAIPEGEERNISDFMMLEIRGCPCIYKKKGRETVIWLLTPDHQWEQLYILVNESSQPNDYFAGAWDCGGGLLFAVFKISGAYLYNLNEAAVEYKEGSGNRMAALSSRMIEYEWPEQFNGTWFGEPSNLLDYRPTLISPASIVGDVALCGHPRQGDLRKLELDEMFLEMTQKWVIAPAMEMLTNL